MTPVEPPPDTLAHRPGYYGAFMRTQAEGAYPNGSRVRKIMSEAKDGHPDGSLGAVLGSMSHPAIFAGLVFYWIEWDARPRTAVGCLAFKLARAA